MRAVIVTGTDTGVGKTVTTAALARVALDRRLAVAVVKPAQTGISDGEPTDVEVIERLSGCSHLTELVRLSDALAPDSAARRAGIELPNAAELATQSLSAAASCDLMLVEGSGGVAVRLDTAGGTLLDLADALATEGAGITFVVVTRLALGTLNHTELTVEAIRRGGHPVAGLVIGAVPEHLGLAERSNLSDLPRVTGLPVLGSLPHGVGHWQPSRFRAACAQWFEPDWLVQP